jgi:hypothetical protein
VFGWPPLFGTLCLMAGRALAYAMLALYVIPLMTYGIWRLWKVRRAGAAGPANDGALVPESLA